MKKLLLATLTTLSFITVQAAAGERLDQGDDYRVEIHLECIMHPVLTETDKKQNPYTKQEYEIMAYYDAVTHHRINTEVETIYIDDQDNRWYFPYDDDKFHKHDGIRMVFEKNYEEEE